MRVTSGFVIVHGGMPALNLPVRCERQGLPALARWLSLETALSPCQCVAAWRRRSSDFLIFFCGSKRIREETPTHLCHRSCECGGRIRPPGGESARHMPPDSHAMHPPAQQCMMHCFAAFAGDGHGCCQHAWWCAVERADARADLAFVVAARHALPVICRCQRHRFGALSV